MKIFKQKIYNTKKLNKIKKKIIKMKILLIEFEKNENLISMKKNMKI